MNKIGVRMKKILLLLGPFISSIIAFAILILLKKFNITPKKITADYFSLFAIPIFIIYMLVIGQIFKGK